MWRPVRQIPPLTSKEIHIWKLHLPELTTWPGIQSLLSIDEIVRANKFRFTVDRTRYVKCRAALRFLLGAYVERDPKDLVFNYSQNLVNPPLPVGIE